MSKRNKDLKKLKKRLRRMEGAAASASGATPAAAVNTGLFGGLSGLLPSKASDQFLLGIALGAAGAWVLTDKELRGRIVKSGLRVYAGLASGVEEMKEQVEDIKAELAAEQAGVV